MHDTYEDVEVGETFEFGTYEATREEMVSFAESYDPQPFHTGDIETDLFDGLVASGWYTASVSIRVLVDNYARESGAMGAIGHDKLRWPAPVRPGDVLSVSMRMGEKEVYDDSRGLVHQEIETVRDDGETVLWMDALVLYPREDASG
jgi:acyl dehydratase